MNDKKARHYAREYALRMLYSLEFHNDKDTLDLPEENPEDFVYDVEYAQLLLTGVTEHFNDINKFITSASKRWNLERIGYVERAILRIAIFEMNFMDPRLEGRVAINEAIILAKKYAHEDAYKFINGVLDYCLGEA